MREVYNWSAPPKRSISFIFMMKIVQIDDEYIDKLVAHFSHVMFSKRFHRSHTRKYVGVIFTINELNYYVPFSSPKNSDITSKGAIKADDLFCARMTEDDGNGGKKLLGTLRFNNMIPVPLIFVGGYSIESETDENYANILAAEWKWITKNQKYIHEKAKKIYTFKNEESKRRNIVNGGRYDAVLPFKDIEEFVKDNYK